MFHRLLHALGLALARYLSEPHPGRQTGIPTDRDALARTLRPGDVLLVDGNSRVSTAIKYLTQSMWSHAALYVGPALGGSAPDGEPLLFVEANMVDGVCKRPLSAYADCPTRICRAHQLRPEELAHLLAAVTGKLGQQYDLKNVFDMARYLLPAPPVHGHWRRRFIAMGSGDPTRAICSSLIAEAFQSVGYPVLPDITLDETQDPARHRAAQQTILHIRNRSLFVPRDFDVSPWLEIVKPALDEGFDFHALRWA